MFLTNRLNFPDSKTSKPKRTVTPFMYMSAHRHRPTGASGMVCTDKFSARRAKKQISTSEGDRKVYFFLVGRGGNSIRLDLFAVLTSAPAFFYGRRPKGCFSLTASELRFRTAAYNMGIWVSG